MAGACELDGALEEERAGAVCGAAAVGGGREAAVREQTACVDGQERAERGAACDPGADGEEYGPVCCAKEGSVCVSEVWEDGTGGEQAGYSRRACHEGVHVPEVQDAEPDGDIERTG